MKCKVCGFDSETNGDGWHDCIKHLMRNDCTECDNLECGCRECDHPMDCSACGFDTPIVLCTDVGHDLFEWLREEFLANPEDGLDIARGVLERVLDHGGPVAIDNEPEGLSFARCADEARVELP